MLATVCADTWNVLNMQHIIPNSKRWDYSDIPGGGHEWGQRTRSHSIVWLPAMASLVTTSSMQQCFNVFLLLFQCCILEIKLTTTTSSIPSIQPMHFLFVSDQSDLPFLRYGQRSVWPWKNVSKFFKNASKIFKENLPHKNLQTEFLQNLMR